MILINVRLPENMLKEIDDLVKSGLYTSRSEAIRDAIRIFLAINRKKIKIMRGE